MPDLGAFELLGHREPAEGTAFYETTSLAGEKRQHSDDCDEVREPSVTDHNLMLIPLNRVISLIRLTPHLTTLNSNNSAKMTM